jgi:hypothetical protein
VEATYDVFHDESEVEHLTGACDDATKACVGKKDKGEPGDKREWRQKRPRTARPHPAAHRNRRESAQAGLRAPSPRYNPW